MSEFDFKVTRDGAIARLDLNRPEEGNALTRAMMLRFAQVLRELGAGTQINAIAIGGRGEQFCRGRDGRGESRAGMTPYEVRVNMMGAVLDAYQAIRDVPVPVVALVHGDALGFGAALAAGCDITLAAHDARFAFPEIEHDIPPTMAMCAALGKVPEKALVYLIYSAERVDAQRAVTLGLASKVLPQATFAADADAFLEKLASRPRLVLETIKRYQAKASHLTPDMAAEYAGTLLALVRS
ncbi:MAG: enoyl-CoA hydratase/isomerase family protein [Betaproteobacteria bacterium]|nr:enoyl-CoA hydratase/isomerase family protein [Betaproteobacteria bacterium]